MYTKYVLLSYQRGEKAYFGYSWTINQRQCQSYRKNIRWLKERLKKTSALFNYHVLSVIVVSFMLNHVTNWTLNLSLCY